MLTIRRTTTTLAVALLLVGAAATPTLAKPRAAASGMSAHQRDARKLLELSGAQQMGKQMISQMLGMMRQNATDVPADFWRTIEKKLDFSALLDELAGLYARHLSHDDIRQLIGFFSSPVGARFVGVQPKVMQDSVAISQKWGQQFMQQVMQELERAKKRGSK
ncbi:MAG: DUF2059 domain-containing protein [Proteobacteria bacterium]|nr:DUF2059 domain-containing protein [Pseudomonadota bacterium]